MTVYRSPLIFSGTYSNTVSDFLPVWVGGSPSRDTTEANIKVKFYTSGWFSNLRANIATNSSTTDSVFTLRINEADSSATLTVGAGLTGQFEDTVNQPTFSANDYAAFAVTRNSGEALSIRSVTVDMLTASAYTKFGTAGTGGVGFGTASATRYMRICSTGALVVTLDDNITAPIPAACTARNGAVSVTSNTRTTTTTYALMANGVDTSLVMSVGSGLSGLFEDTSNTPSLSAGDKIVWRLTTSTGTGTITYRHISAELVNTTAGSISVLSGSNSGSIGSNANIFTHALGILGSNESAEARAQVELKGSGTIQKLYAHAGANSAANTTNLTFRKNGADQSVTTSWAATVTGQASDTTNSFTYTDGDLINFNWTRASGSSGALTTGGAGFELLPDSEADPGGGTVDYTLTCDNAAFTYTGQSANLPVVATMAGGQASFTLTGQSANLIYGSNLSAEHGPFTLTGQAANLNTATSLSADFGSFTVTGQDTSLEDVTESSSVDTHDGFTEWEIKKYRKYLQRLTNATERKKITEAVQEIAEEIIEEVPIKLPEIENLTLEEPRKINYAAIAREVERLKEFIDKTEKHIEMMKFLQEKDDEEALLILFN